MKQSDPFAVIQDWRLNFAAAGFLAASGFLINQWQLALSWGVQLSLGSALIYCVARHLRPSALVCAVAFATLQLIHSPWLWALVILESAVIAFLCRRQSPILVDVAFWMLIAGFLIVNISLGYLVISNSIRQIIAIQAFSSLICVMIGEIVYTTINLSAVSPFTKNTSIDTIIFSALMALVAMPIMLMQELFLEGGGLALIYSGRSPLEILRPDLSAAVLSAQMSETALSQALIWSQLSRMFLLIGVLTAFGLVLGYWAQSMLRRIAISARDIGKIDAKIDRLNGLVIDELDQVADSISAAGTEVAGMARDRRRLAAISKSAPVVLYAVETDYNTVGRLTYISPSAEKIFGWTKADIDDRAGWQQKVHPDDIVAWQASFSRLRQGQTRRAEYRLRHANGDYLWVYDTLTIEFDPITMKPEGVGVLIDINDRKIAAIQLVEADKMASFGRVLAGVTHEISQPLNFIKIAIFNLRRLISQAPQDQVRVMDKLEQLAANADHAAGIVLQMRVFGRASLTGQEPASLSEVVSGLELMIGSQLKLDGVLLDTTGCAVGREMIAEPKLLVQVLMNLLINGRDSINNRIAAGDTTPGRLAVSATREEDDLVITVDDNGTGIPDLALPKLFEPFFTTKPEMQGTGLGLSISYGIIHDMGGSLVAENLAHGARFTITIPAAVS